MPLAAHFSAADLLLHSPIYAGLRAAASFASAAGRGTMMAEPDMPHTTTRDAQLEEAQRLPAITMGLGRRLIKARRAMGFDFAV